MHSASRILLLLGGQLRSKLACTLIVTPLVIAASVPAIAQAATQATEGSTATPTSAIPQQIRYSGKLPTRSSDNVEVTFRIYGAPEGGEPLWSETQQVAASEDASYSVLLGSASSNGLPQSLFADGAARWLGISVDRGEETARVPLPSVPYAMKSADADSLAGHGANDFVTQPQLAQAEQNQLAQVRQLIQTFAQAVPTTPPSNPASAIHPLTSGPVDGSGTTGTVPLWTTSSTIGNSKIVQGTAGIGINQPNPAATLDVGGSENVNGILYLPPLATATTVAGQRSQLLQLSSSAYSNTAKGPVTSTFKILANYVGNDTTSPGGQIEFHYQPTATAASLNVLTIAGTGVITFAPTQAFPGTIKSVSATSPVTAATTSGAATLGLNETTLVSDITPAISSNLATTYAQLGAENYFTQGQVIEGPSSVGGTNNESGAELTVNNSGDTYSSAITASNSGEYGTGIAVTASYGGEAIQAYSQQSASSIGVFGSLANSNGSSNTFALLNDDDGWDAGIWADAPDGQVAALVATSDGVTAGEFYNDAISTPTISVVNQYTGGPSGNVVPGIATVIRAGGSGGICGINQAGSLSCTGQMKTIVPTKDASRQLETYTVQSAENWVEDYGSGQLNHGSATITLETAFADTVNTGVDFHVFLTPGGDCKGLYVTNKTPGSFEVHELGGGASSIPFDYKIVAKRTGLESQRLVDVTDRMKLESEQARLKPLAHPLPRPRKLQRQ